MTEKEFKKKSWIRRHWGWIIILLIIAFIVHQTNLEEELEECRDDCREDHEFCINTYYEY